MAFDIISARGYGSGEDGDATNPATVNHYAPISAVDVNAKTITISGDDTAAFTVGTEIFLHISGTRSDSANKTYLGRYTFAKIMAVDGNTLTLSAKPHNITAANWYYQAITVPHYKTLTINQTVEPTAFSTSTGCGGIFIFKAQKLVMSGAINLVNKGLTEDSQRPLLTQEENGTLDTDTQSGHENYATVENFTLQKGDGAAFVIAKEIEFESTARIGDPNYRGIHKCRGAADSIGRNSEQTNIGGSSIIIVAPSIDGWTSDVVSKYRRKSLATGKGLCRAYVATEQAFAFDEGCYAVDMISTPERLSKDTLINGFGDGSHGAAPAKDIQQNSYAQVSKIINTTYTLINVDNNGKAKFEPGALVMIQATYKDTAEHVGRFIIDKVVGIENDNNGKLKSITLNHNVGTLGLAKFNPTYYNFQAIAIPQYTSYSASNSKTPKFENKRGGIFAIAVKGTCNLIGKQIDVRGKGGSKYFANINNANMRNRLPIGEGHGSVFILAKTLKVDTTTRLGATYTGNAYGGGVYNLGNPIVSNGGYLGKRVQNVTLDKYDGYGGGGYRGGQQFYGHNGGYFGNATDNVSTFLGDIWSISGLQGASLFIVAETVEGMCIDCLSTGGQGGAYGQGKGALFASGEDGGCGYGGGGTTYRGSRLYGGGQGGVHGGGSGGSDSTDNYFTHGGGSSGFCVVYANNVVNS